MGIRMGAKIKKHTQKIDNTRGRLLGAPPRAPPVAAVFAPEGPGRENDDYAHPKYMLTQIILVGVSESFALCRVFLPIPSLMPTLAQQVHI